MEIGNFEVSDKFIAIGGAAVLLLAMGAGCDTTVRNNRPAPQPSVERQDSPSNPACIIPGEVEPCKH